MVMPLVPISKTKIKGNEFRYSDSLYYEWYVKFQDNTIILMFDDFGNEIQMYTAHNYRSTSSVIEIGIQPYSQDKADLINENQSHTLMVIASNNPIRNILINPSQEELPYVMRRRLQIDTIIQWVYIVGIHKNTNLYTLIQDKTGDMRNVNTKNAKWLEGI